MNREERCLIAIEKGYTYDPETGKIYGVKGGEIKTLRKDGYKQLCMKLNKKVYRLLGHHFAWYCFYKTTDFEQLDHINTIRSDNRIQNLRIVNNQQNCFNKKTTKGYYYCKQTNKYRATICYNYKIIALGRFDTEQEARQAYLQAKEKYHVI